MKLSFALPAVDALGSAELEHQIREVSALGYAAVEFMVNEPLHADKTLLHSLLNKYSIKVSGFRSGAAYAADPSMRLSSPQEENRRRTVERLKEMCDLCGEFGAYLMVGLIQGHLEKDEDFHRAQQWIIDGLREVSEYAGTVGTTVMYEPVNRFELAYHNNVQEVTDVVERINDGLAHKVKLLLDVYHMHLEDPSIPSAFIRGMKWMGHVHVSDSTRQPPGCGSIDFTEVFKVLYAMNYKGYVTVECLPVPSLLESAKQSIEYLNPIIASTRKFFRF